MTHDQFIALERVAQRAINAAKTFASGSDVKQLNTLSTVMAELRHASMTLSNPSESAEARKEASLRLQWLFSESCTPEDL